MSLSAKMSSDIIVTTLINLSQKIRGLVFIPLISRVLGTASYGAFIQVEVVASMCAKFSQLGLENALIRFAQDRKRTERSQLYVTVTFISVTVSFVLGILTFLLAEYLSSLFLSSSTYTPLFQVGALLVPIYTIQEMGQNYYRSEMRIKRFSVLEGIKTYLNVGTVILVVLGTDYGLLGLVTAVVMIELLFALVLQATVLRSTGFHLPEVSEIGKYLQYSVPIMVGDVSGIFQDRVDRLLLGFFIGANAVGVYSIAYTIAKLLRLYILPLRITFFPEFSRLWEEGEQERCFRFLTNGTRYLVGLAIPSIVGLYLIGEQLVGLLSTETAASHAPSLLPILAAGITLIGLDTLYRQVFFADGKTTIVSLLRVGWSVLNVGLNISLIPSMGILGAALATLCTFFVGFAVLYLLTRHSYGITIDWIFIYKVIISTSVMFLLMVTTGIEHIGALLFLCPIVYFSVLILTKGVQPREIRFIMSSAKSALTRL